MKLINTNALAELIKQFNNGDLTKFQEIYDLTWKHVYYAIAKRTGDCDEIKDILQEVYIQVYASLHKLEDEKAFLSWVDRMIANKYVDYVRRNSKYTIGIEYDKKLETIVEDDRDYNPEEKAILNEEYEELNKIIDALPKAQRDIIRMFYFEEKSVSDIATFYKISENAVWKRLFDARKAIKKRAERVSKKFCNRNSLLSVGSPLLVAVLVDEFITSSSFASQIAGGIFNNSVIEFGKKGLEETAKRTFSTVVKSTLNNFAPHVALTKTIAVVSVSVSVSAVAINYVATEVFRPKTEVVSDNKDLLQAEYFEIKTEEPIINVKIPTEKSNNYSTEQAKETSSPSHFLSIPTQTTFPQEVAQREVNYKYEPEQSQEITETIAGEIPQSEALPTEPNIKTVTPAPSEILPSEKPAEKLPPIKKTTKIHYDPSEAITEEKFIEDIYFLLSNSFDIENATAENFLSDIDFTKGGNYKTTILSQELSKSDDKREVIILVDVEIIDKSPPIIELKSSSIQTTVNNKLSQEDISSLCKIKITDGIDQNPIPIFVGIEEIDFSQAGEYLIFVFAKDKTGNVSARTSIIITVN